MYEDHRAETGGINRFGELHDAYVPSAADTWLKQLSPQEINGGVPELVVRAYDWVDGIWANFGLLLKEDNSGRETEYASKEWGTSHQRPYLVWDAGWAWSATNMAVNGLVPHA